MEPSYVACLSMFHVAILVNCGIVVRCGMFTLLVDVVSTDNGSVLGVSCGVDGGGRGVGVERPEVGRGGRVSRRCGGWPVARTEMTTSRMWFAAS